MARKLYRYKPRVDWDAEIRKTERIQRRGFAMSFLSFALAGALIFGSASLRGIDIKVPLSVVGAGVFAASCAAVGVISRRRAAKRAEEEQAQMMLTRSRASRSAGFSASGSVRQPFDEYYSGTSGNLQRGEGTDCGSAGNTPCEGAERS